ncbi:MAG: YcfL family protein [Pseudomonadota bacterium]
MKNCMELFLQRTLCVAGLLMLFSMVPTSAKCSTFDDKLESFGKMLYLEVTDLKEVQRNGLLNIQMEITNRSRGNQQLFYRFKWLDASGFVVWQEEPWKPLLVHGQQKQIVTVVGPTTKATDFRLQLQSPKNRAQ